MIWGHRGDWFGVDFAIGNDPVMKYDKIKVIVGKDVSLEATVIQAIANRHDVKVTDIHVGHIVRMDS